MQQLMEKRSQQNLIRVLVNSESQQKTHVENSYGVNNYVVDFNNIRNGCEIR